MGIVYVAHDTRLERRVALKVLPQAIARDAKAIALFEQEARILAALDHPNIAMIYSLERSEDLSFITLQLVPGDTLAVRLTDGPLTLEDAISVALQTASALEAAHKKGVIHRDLKPANIQVTPDGVVKVLDFGLAQMLRSDSLSEERADHVTGTAGYMSPEQFQLRAPDVWTDIWSFGCIIYECLTGTKAFDGSSVGEIYRATLTADPDVERLPENFRELVERCLAKNPSDRWSSFIEVKEALDGAVSEKDLERTLSETRERALKVGQKAPRFALANSEGVMKSSETLCSMGPLILHFYRGVWWPFCTAELEALDQISPDLAALGASLVVVSPQLPEYSRGLRKDKCLTFDLLSDPGNQVADAFGVRFALPEKERSNYRNVGLDLAVFNGDDSWTLPLPARFVMDQEGIIRDAVIQTDITVRPDPRTALEIVHSLRVLWKQAIYFIVEIVP
jgi:serine/threonine protein kinase